VNELLQDKMAARIAVEPGAIEQALKVCEVSVQITGDQHILCRLIQLDNHSVATWGRSEQLGRSLNGVNQSLGIRHRSTASWGTLWCIVLPARVTRGCRT
jgi:hypothetical protein